MALIRFISDLSASDTAMISASRVSRYVHRLSTRKLSTTYPCSNEVPPNILTRSVEEENKGLSSMDHLLRAVSESDQMLSSKPTFMDPRETRRSCLSQVSTTMTVNPIKIYHCFLESCLWGPQSLGPRLSFIRCRVRQRKLSRILMNLSFRVVWVIPTRNWYFLSDHPVS